MEKIDVNFAHVVCLDIETGGLSPELPITEISYYNHVMPKPVTLIPPHDESLVGDWARENTQYEERGLNLPENWCSEQDLLDFFKSLERKTILGSNPRFDTLRLSSLFTSLQGKNGLDISQLEEPWNYRLIDVAAIGSFYLGFSTPQGLHKVSQKPKELGFEIPEPNHTGERDVETTWACYKALITLRNRNI